MSTAMPPLPRTTPRRVGRPPGPATDPAVRREELLEAASRVIRRKGPAASMEEIAAEAGLTKPILYTHFGDKGGLADALAERFASGLVERILEKFESDAAPLDMVRSSIDAFIGFAERDPHLYRFLVRGAAGAPQGFIEQRLVLEVGSRLAEVLRSRVPGWSGRAATELWAFAILGMVFAGAEWWLVRPTISRTEVVGRLSDLVWSGLGGGIGD